MKYINSKKCIFIGNYLPRTCGIATFTYDLSNAIQRNSDYQCDIIAMNDIEEGYPYPENVKFCIDEHNPESYIAAAKFINTNDYDVVCLQHEYGIFGGISGVMILDLLRLIEVPIVVTFHTILKEPTKIQKDILTEIARLASGLVTMSQQGRTFLIDQFNAEPDKIHLVHHGVPDIPFEATDKYKKQHDLDGKPLIMTFGLLSKNKGIENAIKSLAIVKEQGLDFNYLIIGATHPNLIRNKRDQYREYLTDLVKTLKLTDNVHFINSFLEYSDLVGYLQATDIYITPYLNEAQITSGTLAYAVGCGKAIVSTPYWYAQELLKDDCGKIVPFGDHLTMADSLIQMISDSTYVNRLRKKAWQRGRLMIWPAVARDYAQLFDQSIKTMSKQLIESKIEDTDSILEEPVINADYLHIMTDPTGLFQHAVHSTPDYRHGYCSDDNARALILTCQMDRFKIHIPGKRKLASTYAAFINYSWDTDTQKFRNFMSYDRKWLESEGSQDSTGRILWALGTASAWNKSRSIREWATSLLKDSLSLIDNLTFLRSRSFAILGLCEYLTAHPKDNHLYDIMSQLTNNLLSQFKANKTQKWQWFDNELTYDNAIPAWALFKGGLIQNKTDVMLAGKEAMKWLIKVQTGEKGEFCPIGSNGFWPRNGEKAIFDQQPLEAGSMVLACADIFSNTKDYHFADMSWTCFNWFLGKNITQVKMYDESTGGCFDGLKANGVNQNRGAESVLAWLLAATAIKGHGIVDLLKKEAEKTELALNKELR